MSASARAPRQAHGEAKRHRPGTEKRVGPPALTRRGVPGGGSHVPTVPACPRDHAVPAVARPQTAAPAWASPQPAPPLTPPGPGLRGRKIWGSAAGKLGNPPDPGRGSAATVAVLADRARASRRKAATAAA